MKIIQLLFVLLSFGTLSNLSAQALQKNGQIVPIITRQQATEIEVNSLKIGITAQQERDIINNNLKLEMPAGGTEGQILKIIGGIAVWVDAIKTKTFYEDTDRDGYGIINSTTDAISAPNGYVANSTDCNDGDSAINPATVWYIGLDTDGDTFFGSTTALIQCESPGLGYVTTEPTTPDCDDNDATINPNMVWYLGVDADNDTYIGSVTQVIQCESPGVDYALIAPTIEDCNDDEILMNPATVWYIDFDNDGFGDATNSEIGCLPSLINATQNNTDCNDNDAAINPITIWYLDADGDNYAISKTTLSQCESPGVGYTTDALPLGDCNDNDAAINPVTIWYLDADGDNYAVATISQCTSPGVGYTTAVLPLSDCNDSVANGFSINPGIIEDLGNGIDDNCDLRIDEVVVVIGDLVEGGIVFWVDPQDNRHGLVCALENQNNSWDQTSWYDASLICLMYETTQNGILYNDWYLPTIEELSLMWTNLADSDGDGRIPWGDPNDLGGFGNEQYWSSTKANEYGAWQMSMSSGAHQYDHDIFFIYGGEITFIDSNARAIRAF
jgi:hypothetical protein